MRLELYKIKMAQNYLKLIIADIKNFIYMKYWKYILHTHCMKFSA